MTLLPKAVLELFGKMAGEEDMTKAYKSIFGTLRDDLSTAAGEATDPGFAAVLKAIADEAGKLATASDVVMEDNDPLAELGRKGSLRMTCEISARSAGLTGFLRVWIGPPAAAGGARAALKELLTGTKSRKAGYTPMAIGGRDGMELKYELYSELMEEYSRRRAFAVETPAGAVVVELSGLESDDPAMQSAYELARSTLTVTS